MKKHSKLIGAAAAGMLAVLTVATPASASTYTVTYPGPHAGDLCTDEPNFCDGSASFVRDGDHLLVWDNNEDGHSVMVMYYRSDSGNTQIKDWNHYKVGSRLDINMNLPEDGWVEYRVCLGDYSTRTYDMNSCSGWLHEGAS
ncbi:hypothetical protein EAO71_00990 [Streptomyces sp. ms191]|uniref:hypothetical protein n=1 Tax=Streptomyces sp. ms191 TaxID=1827978 RepID=UPI0011CE0C5E|nr:hypothetical protein [Streptomyces sp. ms191]TXS34526.1 hypothetical protein EAO71_00990 [Streptomyces sp. ms191]